MSLRTSTFLVVLTLSATSAGGGATARSALSAEAPVVSAGIVGKKSRIFAPRLITARAATVRVGKRRCGVAAGTPLAALAALHRIDGPAFTLRDYGSCSRNAVNSTSLFVTSIAGVRNSGQSGWVYSVDGKTGTAGAADPGGPFGSGTLRGSQKVLWYWCDMRKKARC